MNKTRTAADIGTKIYMVSRSPKRQHLHMVHICAFVSANSNADALRKTADSLNSDRNTHNAPKAREIQNGSVVYL